MQRIHLHRTRRQQHPHLVHRHSQTRQRCGKCPRIVRSGNWHACALENFQTHHSFRCFVINSFVCFNQFVLDAHSDDAKLRIKTPCLQAFQREKRGVSPQCPQSWRIFASPPPTPWRHIPRQFQPTQQNSPIRNESPCQYHTIQSPASRPSFFHFFIFSFFNFLIFHGGHI